MSWVFREFLNHESPQKLGHDCRFLVSRSYVYYCVFHCARVCICFTVEFVPSHEILWEGNPAQNSWSAKFARRLQHIIMKLDDQPTCRKFEEQFPARIAAKIFASSWWRWCHPPPATPGPQHMRPFMPMRTVATCSGSAQIPVASLSVSFWSFWIFAVF